MKTEIEARFLRINENEIRKKLSNIGAKLVQPKTKMTRRHYDYPDERLKNNGAWLRIRDEGNKITMSYKVLTDRSITGTKESSIVVDSFQEAESIIQSLGLLNVSTQETYRESWTFNDAELEIDYWPWIEPQLEIEAESEEEVKLITDKLGLNWKDAHHGSVEVAYTDAFNIKEEQFYDLEVMLIEEAAPNWLEELRK